LSIATVSELLDAGMHYGHHMSRWNPKMKAYIFGRRNLIHIINLRETMRGLITASKFIVHVVSQGKPVVFVGTKRQARRSVHDEALRCGMPYVVERWLGGTLTNFRTIRSRLDRLVELESIVESEQINQYSKKEGSRMKRELAKIRRNLEGIRNMDAMPGAVIIIDPRRERNAVAEAQRLNIPTICLADTDADPDMADVLIPGNDDAMRSIGVVMRIAADAVLAGKEKRRTISRVAAEAAVQASQAGAGHRPAAPAAAPAPAAPAVPAPAETPASEPTGESPSMN
jgi:small subunit ribosomal protein S2